MNIDFDKTIGYSPLEYVDVEKMRRVIQINKEIIGKYYSLQSGDLILVAGAGRGDEAVLVNQEFGNKTIGIDLNITRQVLWEGNPDVFFQRQDMTGLAFGNAVFSLVYSYHVIEHVSHYLIALHELCRVLKPDGVLFIGFPNKHRLLSYFRTSQRATSLEKLKWNINDYLYRFKGQFENKYGAHAGFSEQEFVREASKIFSVVHPVRDQYMLLKYKKFHGMIQALISTGLAEIFFPSNYYICVKAHF
jgi:ubiquinone/menaquinone biosynthesis C-methylase UbiE